jgi:enamine deaminase RidA (YjgF/YER057c/UK114 family)
VPSDATGKLIGEGDFDAQVEQVFTDSRRYINLENPPASTFLVVTRLMRPVWLIEIEAVAAIEE